MKASLHKIMDVSRFSAAPRSYLSSYTLESQRAFPSENAVSDYKYPQRAFHSVRRYPALKHEVVRIGSAANGIGGTVCVQVCTIPQYDP